MTDQQAAAEPTSVGSNASETSVKVAVRIRPLVGQEVLHGSRPCLNFDRNVVSALDKTFEFDHVLPPTASQQRVYEVTTRPLIEQFFQGFNATVLAYGQTASGKTFTLGNTLAIAATEDSSGIMPRLLKDIFNRLAAEAKKPEEERQRWTLQLSYLEIYQEEVKDLLRMDELKGGNQDGVLTIREDASGDVMVAGLTTHNVSTMEEVSDLLYRGALCRATASTNMNAHSSRSHAICTLYLEGWSEADPQACCRSKFHLVDLAGSERAKRTGAEGERLREGININRGLLALGNVISALTDPARRKGGHVPYRDAKITRLLQDSLGGNSYTAMIACVSPADENLDETVNTLRYAQRARSIRNMATQNILARDDAAAAEEVLALRRELKAMQLQLIQARSSHSLLRNDPYQEPVSAEVFNVLKEENERLRETVAELERVAKAATEETMMVGLRLECMRMRCEQLVSLAREGGVELPAEVVEGVEEQMKEDETAAAAPSPEDGDESMVMTGELEMLNEDIRAKEEAMANMCRDGRFMASLRSFFEGTIERLQAEVKTLQDEREDLAHALNRTQAEGAKADPSVVAAMRARERDLEKKIKDLQTKEASHRRVLQLKAKAETEVQKLKVEIEDAKKRQGALLRKTRQETQKLCKEKRSKELEAVRLRRNESKMKYEFERKLESYAKHEAVLRRKVEEAAAASLRYQETIKRLTEGRKGKEQQLGGFRQQERQRELRRFVEREMEACAAITAAREALRRCIDQRAESAMRLADIEARLQGSAVPTSEEAALKKEAEARRMEVQDLSTKIQAMQKDVMDMEAKAASAAGAGLVMVEADDAAGADDASSTRRWGQIRTLGEARLVLAMLFEKALTTTPQTPREPAADTTTTTTSMQVARKKSGGAAATKPAAAAVASKPNTAAPSAAARRTVIVESDEEEEDEEESESDEEEEESDDSDYDPDNSPSKVAKRKRSGGGGKKEAATTQQQLEPPKPRRQRAAPTKKKESKKRISLEDEIDALLSDDDEGGEDDVPLPAVRPRLSMLEPLEAKTVSELKVTLKALKLPSSGKKELLVQRIRARLQEAASPIKQPAPEPTAAAVIPVSSAAPAPTPATAPPPIIPTTAAPQPRVPFRDIKNTTAAAPSLTTKTIMKPSLPSFNTTKPQQVTAASLLKPAVSSFKAVARPLPTHQPRPAMAPPGRVIDRQLGGEGESRRPK